MVKAVPDGYHTLTPYLTVPDAERILRFLQDVFGARLMERFNRPDVDAAFNRAIDAGGKSLMEVATHFYGDRSGGFEDPAGNWWWVATHVEDVTPEEMQRRHAAQEELQSH